MASGIFDGMTTPADRAERSAAAQTEELRQIKAAAEKQIAEAQARADKAEKRERCAIRIQWLSLLVGLASLLVAILTLLRT